MKTILFTAVFASVALTAGANTAIPQYYSEDWRRPVAESGWTVIGSGKTPSGATAESIGSDSWSLVEFPYGISYMASTSTTAEGGKVNCRLLSPVVEIPSGGAVLSLDAVNWNPNRAVDNKLSVYVVSDGEEENYGDYEALYSRRIPANNYPSPEHIGLPLGDFAGETVRIVLVNEGNDCGLLGVGNLSVSLYDAEIRDLSPLYLKENGVWIPEVSVAIASCSESFTAKLKEGDNVLETLTVETDPSEGYSTYPVEFRTLLKAEGNAARNYVIEIAPKDSEAYSLSAKGSAIFGGGFPGVVVEEEGTGEQCGNCPYGAAGLERFSDLYPERFFGIAIHCTDQFSGMAMRAPGYALQFEKNPSNPILGLPSALINRAVSINPSNLPQLDERVSELLEKETPVKVDITRVNFNEETAETEVLFSVTGCADMDEANLCATVVLTADGLRGSGPEWTQTNYLSGATRPDGVDDSWWEYLRFYFEYPSKYILSGDYEYNHVALGIYPDFNGEAMPLAEKLGPTTPIEESISFVMPMQTEANGFGVQDTQNTSVTVMVMDRRNGEVLSAARVEAPNYNCDLSKVDEAEIGQVVSSEARFYDLSGREVDALRCPSGIYIRVCGPNRRKIIIRN